MKILAVMMVSVALLIAEIADKLKTLGECKLEKNNAGM
jgi:hypothetical protein